MIVAEGLTKRFGETQAVHDVSFEAKPGQVVGFLGHNGAGKTTTLRMLLGHVRPDSGRATVLGKPFAELDHPLAHVGVLLGLGLHPGRTARDHLRVSAAVGGLSADRVDFLLDLVGLADDAGRRVGGFSHGMRQRLGLATALLADPEVLILDEPATGLDPEGIRWLRTLVRKLADGGRTVLLSSHQLAEVAQTVDHVVVIDRGSIVARCPLDELVRQAGTEVVVRSPGAEALAEELERAGIAAAAVSDGELKVKDVPARVVAELAEAAGVPVWELTNVEPSLEDVFFELTRRADDGGPAAGSDEPPNGDGPAGQGDRRHEREDGGDPLLRAEEEVGRDLSRLSRLGVGRVVAVLAPAEGLGRTTLSFLLGEVLAAGMDARVLAAALSCDRGRMGQPAPAERRSRLGLTDLLQDLPGFDDAARIAPYVSITESGLHTLSGARLEADLAAVTPDQVEALLDFAGRFYELIVLDVGALPDAALRAVLRRADEVVLLATPDAARIADSPVVDAVAEERSERATLVFNRVDDEAAVAFAEHGPQGPHAVVPRDRELIRALDRGGFDLDEARPLTRVALKRVGLVVAEGLR